MTSYHWEDLAIGVKHSFTAAFTEDMMDRYAELSGDRNPLHGDRAYAEQHGFPNRVVFGLMSASLYSQLVGMYLPGQFALLHGMNLDLNAPCYPGDLLHVEGEVSFMNEAYKRLEVRGRIRRQDRTLISKATLRIGLYE